MHHNARTTLLLSLAILLLLGVKPTAAETRQGHFEEADRVAILGNTFAERLQLYGHFEAALLAATPELRLTVRNLAWSGDEVALRPRPLNFGTVEDHLREQEIDVALLFYGANEAFAGAEGVEPFKVDLTRFLDRLALLAKGERQLRLILVSPIPQERIDRLPDPVSKNADLDLYRQAIAAVAIERDLPFVDIFARSAVAMQKSEEALTINGVHLNEHGDRVIASILIEALGLSDPAVVPFSTTSSGAHEASLPEGLPSRPLRLPVMTPMFAKPEQGEARHTQFSLIEEGKVLATASVNEWRDGLEIESARLAAAAERLRQTVNRKSRLFFDRYRAVNGYYIYGERRNPFGVVSFPPEMKRFDELVAALDRELHELAAVPADLVWRWRAEPSE